MSYPSSRDRSERQGSARPSASISGRSSTSMTSAPTYWRREETPGIGGSYQGGAGFYSAPYDPQSPMMTDGYGTPRPRGSSVLIGENNVPLSTIVPGNAYPTETQLNLAYAYGIQREDGSYTRLIRADSLADYHNVPFGQGPEGLIILPSPRQVDPAHRHGPEIMIPSYVSYPNSTFMNAKAHPEKVVEQLPANRRRGPVVPVIRPDPNDATQVNCPCLLSSFHGFAHNL